jgi:predicted HicB family RNase H-like nuclease
MSDYFEPMVIYRYGDYLGSCEYDSYSGTYHGRILDVEALVTYESECLENLRDAFEEAIDDYTTP